MRFRRPLRAGRVSVGFKQLQLRRPIESAPNEGACDERGAAPMLKQSPME
jgi:hypothetical protein